MAAGLALGNLAEEHENSASQNDVEVKDYYSGKKKVKAVKAHEYTLGIGTGYYMSIGITDFSVCLRDEDGYISYNSQINASFGNANYMGSRNLPDEIADIKNSGGYVCSYFYSTAFDETDEYKRSIKKAYEIALINEASKSGVDDILIIGLKPTAENIDEMEAFVSELSVAAGNSALGILASAEDVKLTDQGVYMIPRLRAVCDFTALDLRDMPRDAATKKAGQEKSELSAYLGEMEYYIKSGSMRLVFSTGNSSLMNSATDLGVTSAQIVE